MAVPVKHWGLRRVLNAYDKATPLGGARVPASVAAAVDAIMPEIVEMDRLLATAGRAIAKYAGCEDGTLTHCAAAAITVNVAACMTGNDPEKVLRLPDTDGMPDRVVIQKGHLISFGAPVAQMIRLSGAGLLEVGDAEGCTVGQIAEALATPGVAAMFAVESYHTRNYPGVQLPELAALCKSARIPLVVDAATQELRLQDIMAQGPDLVGCSAQKYFQSLTAGVIAGRRDLIQAVNLQQRGVGRGMKPTKEGAVALLAALENMEQRSMSAWEVQEQAKIEELYRTLREVPGVTAEFSPDPNGCPIMRLRLTFDGTRCKWDADGLRKALQAPDQDPAVYVRIYGGEPDAVYLNATELTAEETRLVGERMLEMLQ